MQSIGERLEEARKRKGISIREAAEATKIRGDYLHKFENNQFDIKLPEIYIRGFLRTYANFLKVPPEKIVADYNALGIAEAKAQRALSRDSYGRMDLTIGSKMDKDSATEKNPSIGGTETAAPLDTGHKNPATFTPRSEGGNPIDKNLLLKGGLAIVALALVAVIVFMILSDGDSKPKEKAAEKPSVIWVKAAPGETTLTLKAIGPVSITATESDGTVLFQGDVPNGDFRPIPWRGPLNIKADPHQNLQLELSGYPTPQPMPSASANIAAPPSQRR